MSFSNRSISLFLSAVPNASTPSIDGAVRVISQLIGSDSSPIRVAGFSSDKAVGFQLGSEHSVQHGKRLLCFSC